MNRRGFLASCLALAAAPAIVRADSLMRIVPIETTVVPAIDPLVAKLMADEAERAAFAAGLQIREVTVMDIGTGLLVTRWDVTSEDAAGAWHQDGVDMRLPGGPTDEDRAIVRDLLAARLRHGGLRPTQGILVIPDGMQGRFL